MNPLIEFEHKRLYYHLTPVLGNVNEIFVYHLELPQNLIVVLCNQKPIHSVDFPLNLLLKFEL